MNCHTLHIGMTWQLVPHPASCTWLVDLTTRLRVNHHRQPPLSILLLCSIITIPAEKIAAMNFLFSRWRHLVSGILNSFFCRFELVAIKLFCPKYLVLPGNRWLFSFFSYSRTGINHNTGRTAAGRQERHSRRIYWIMFSLLQYTCRHLL